MSNNITQKVQKALSAYLVDQIFDDFLPEFIFRGLSNELGFEPIAGVQRRIVCECNTARRGARNTGNWVATASVLVYHHSQDTTEDAHLESAGLVFDSLNKTEDEMKAGLSVAIGEFTVHLYEATNQGYTLQGNYWVSEFTLLITCCGSEVT